MIVEVHIEDVNGKVIDTLPSKTLPADTIPKRVRVPLRIGGWFMRKRKIFVVVQLKVEDREKAWLKDL